MPSFQIKCNLFHLLSARCKKSCCLCGIDSLSSLTIMSQWMVPISTWPHSRNVAGSDLVETNVLMMRLINWRVTPNVWHLLCRLHKSRLSPGLYGKEQYITHFKLVTSYHHTDIDRLHKGIIYTVLNCHHLQRVRSRFAQLVFRRMCSW